MLSDTQVCGKVTGALIAGTEGLLETRTRPRVLGGLV